MMELDVTSKEPVVNAEVKERKKPGPKPKSKPAEVTVEEAEKLDSSSNAAEPAAEVNLTDSSEAAVAEPETNTVNSADAQPDAHSKHLPVGSIIATHGRTIVIHKYANLSDIGTRHSGVVRVVENNNGLCWVRYMVSGFGPCMGYIHEDKLNKYMK